MSLELEAPADVPDVTSVSGDYPLYLSEGATAARVGVHIGKWREIARVLERDGLPKRNPLFAGKRYWPSVRAFLDAFEGIGQHVHVGQQGKENWDPPVRRGRRKFPPDAQSNKS